MIGVSQRAGRCVFGEPGQFFRKRVLPPKPPSVVKLASIASGVITGSGVSTPTSDQVPLEMYAKSSFLAGTATTSEAVS